MIMSQKGSKENIEATNKEQSSTNTEPLEINPEDKWLIRDCDEVYWDEYKECTSFKGRFHQYFIFGEMLDCNRWRKDYDNCCKYRDHNDVKAGLSVIESETARRQERLRAHYGNHTWRKREAPPLDWDKPLPEWMVKRDEHGVLAARAKEIREGQDLDEPASSCAIM